MLLCPTICKQIIPPTLVECIKHDERLLFYTQTLKPKYYGVTPSQQLASTFDKLMRLIKPHSFGYVVPELTIQGNIHYHSIIHIIDIPDVYEKLLRTLKTQIGLYDIRPIKPTITDLERVWKYMHKDIEKTQSYVPYYHVRHYDVGERLQLKPILVDPNYKGDHQQLPIDLFLKKKEKL